MDAHGWFVAFHLVGLLIYAGGLLNLSRLLGYHVKEGPEVRARLSWMEKRMYFFVTLPGLLMVAVFGLLLLFGVGREGASVITYVKPYLGDGHEVKSHWYITFHVKLLLVAILLGLDFYMGSQIVKLGRGGEPPKAKRFKILHGLIALTLILLVILMKAGPFMGS